MVATSPLLLVMRGSRERSYCMPPCFCAGRAFLSDIILVRVGHSCPTFARMNARLSSGWRFEPIPLLNRHIYLRLSLSDAAGTEGGPDGERVIPRSGARNVLAATTAGISAATTSG